MMSEKKAKMHELFEEAISPEAEVVNFKALHDLLEAQIDYQSDGSISGTASTTGDFLSKRGSMIATSATATTGRLASDQQTDVIPSQTGWIAKASCCDDLNKKLFGTNSSRTSTVEAGDLSGRVNLLDDKLDDFVSDTSRRMSKIGKRVKDLEKPSSRKIEWDQNL